MLGVFLRANLRLDIWDAAGPGYWSPLNDVHEGFEKLFKQLPYFTEPRPIDAVQRFAIRIDNVMRQAADLGRMYEELVREWRLPTTLAILLDDSSSSKYRPIDHRKSDTR
jgi:hypothetical protein